MLYKAAFFCQWDCRSLIRRWLPSAGLGCQLPGWDGRYLAAPSSVHDVVTTGSPGSAAVAPGGSGRAPASSPSLSAEDGGVEAGEAPVPTDGAAFPSKLGSGVGMSAACTALLAPQPIPRHRGGLY